MSDITFALAIPHTPWIPERVESMKRLRTQLGIGENVDELPEHGPVAYRSFTDRTTNDRWSEDLWKWAIETGATHLLQLQDDVEVAPTFWKALRAIVETVPDSVIGLEVAHPIAQPLCSEDVRLFTTSDMVIGPGYVVPIPVLKEFLRWRETALREGWRTAGPEGGPGITEDTMLGVFCMVTVKKVVHPVPTIIDHDVSIASTYGNDAHTHRRPYVTWKDAAKFAHAWDDSDLEAPGYWQGLFKRMRQFYPDGTVGELKRAYNTRPQDVRVPHLGRFYDATPELAQRWVKGFGNAEFMKSRRDDGANEKRRLTYARRARVDYASRKKVLICTPTRGGTQPSYTTSMLATAQLFEVDIENGLELLDTWLWHEDVVRVRSRFVRSFLETDADYLHFRDADVVAHSSVLLGMIRADKDFVACPYPRRDGIDWSRIRTAVQAGLPVTWPLEGVAYSYPVAFLDGAKELRFDETDCTEMNSMPLGCALIKRELLETMIEHYGEIDSKRVDIQVALECAESESARLRTNSDVILEAIQELQRWRAGHMGLRFTDMFEGHLHPTVALFQLLVDERGTLRSEDASFCRRARDIGAKVHMYLGPGSPVDHVGEHTYKGRIEAFGMQRTG